MSVFLPPWSHAPGWQGVHALFEGAPDRRWREDEKRENRIVFIGRNLDAEELRKGFQECLMEPAA